MEPQPHILTTHYDSRWAELRDAGREVMADVYPNAEPWEDRYSLLPYDGPQIAAMEDAGLMTDLRTGDLLWEPSTPLHRRRAIVALFVAALTPVGATITK